MTEQTKTLDLSKIFTRDDVKMPDGSSLELRNKQELSIVEDHKLRALIKQIGEFSETASESEEDAEKASQMLRDLSTMLVVGAPADVPDWACVEIFRFWTARAEGEKPANPPRRPQDRKRKTVAARKRTTAASSHGSKRSTAATRKSGTKKSRGGR